MANYTAKAAFPPDAWHCQAHGAQTRGTDLFFRLAVFRAFVHGMMIQATGREDAGARGCAPRRFLQFTFKVSVEVLLTPPAVAVSVRLYVPAGVPV
jgi:hypothetical protein